MIQFERVYCVNLERRPDRWQDFLDGLPADWPFPAPQRYPAIDGQQCPAPKFWKQGNGAWGCYRSHVRILEDCLAGGVESVLLLEDDARFVPRFRENVERFLAALPADWQLLYLGGQHIQQAKGRPKYVNDHVYSCFNVNRTHAFAVRGGDFMRKFYKHLHRWNEWRRGNHIDHHIGRMVMKGEARTYCPARWLVGQAGGVSDISRKDFQRDRFYNHAEQSAPKEQRREPFVAVVGLHSSGSSCTAGVLYHLGLHLGNKLGGYYGNNPERLCGFEASGLASICEAAIPFPATEIQQDVKGRLKRWVGQRRREAIARRMIAAGKYPMLCRMGDALLHAAGDDMLRVVDCRRPIEQSIESIIRRCPRRDPEQLAAHQRWLQAGKQELLARLPPEHVLGIDYDELLADPATQIDRICEFLNLQPVKRRRERALKYVDPAQRHVRR